MRDDVIYRKLCVHQGAHRLPVFDRIRHFLRPPGDALGPEFHIPGGAAAHGEDFAAIQREKLAAHQVDDVVRHAVYLAAVPQLHRILVQQAEILVVAIDKQRGEPFAFKPAEPEVVRTAWPGPHAAEVAADQHIIVFGQLFLFGERLGRQFCHVIRNMRVACDIDHAVSPLLHLL